MNKLEAEHTPGPWTSHTTGFYQNPFKVLAPRRAGAVANVPRSTIARDGEQEANARLIAAAPELLTALESMIINYAQFGRVSEKFVQDCAQLTRKAKGQSK